MSTKRTPINRPARQQIPPEALDIFRKMKTVEQRDDCRCEPRDWDGAYWDWTPCRSCEEWNALNAALCRPLKLRPWQFPAVEHPDAQCPYPAGSHAAAQWKPDLEAQARYRELENALAERGGGRRSGRAC
jgi:hypothetical protein